MKEDTLLPERYKYGNCLERIEQCGNNPDKIKNALLAILQLGRECYNRGAEFEYDALCYFEFVLEQATVVENDTLCHRPGLEDVAREAYEDNASLASCDSDYVWEKSAMVRMKYKALFEK